MEIGTQNVEEGEKEKAGALNSEFLVPRSNLESPARVLIVDDDRTNQRLMALLLDKEGYQLVFVSNGAAALEDATRNAPDVVLLDVVMPNMDGFDVCRHMRLDSLLAEVPIIMITSLDDHASRLQGLAAGADDFISRPVDGAELKARIGNTVHLNRYRKLLNERARAQRAEASIKTQAARNVVPSLVSSELPEDAQAVPHGKPSEDARLLRRFSLAMTGARAQFAVAMALTSVIPLLLIVFLGVTGELGTELTLDRLWPMAVAALFFMGLGYWILVKYPINIIRLRRYLEVLAHGAVPGNVALVTDEDDLASIEVLLRKVVKQTEARVRTIEAQTDALLDAERQRVMIQSLGTACHHLGQPATLIIAYLELTQRMALPPEAQAMLKECRDAATAMASILERLQRLTVYRTEPYLSQNEPEPSTPDANELIKL